MPSLRRVGPGIACALVGAACAAAAAWHLASTFMPYDDEGYVLYSLKNFAEHGHLYGEVATQYGPVPYLIFGLLHAAGLPLTHATGRLVTLVFWMACAFLVSGFVWRATRHLALALFCLAGTVLYLGIMVNEPTHPGGLIAFLCALLALLGWTTLSTHRFVPWAGGTGALVAALVLTKINVGILAGVATVAAWLLFHRNAAVRRLAPWLVGAGLALLPLVLMHPLLGTAWVQTFALAFILAALPAVGAASRWATGVVGGAELGAGLAAAAIVGAVVGGAILGTGTRAADVLRGVLLDPLQHPGHFALRFPWPAGVTAVAAVSFAAFATAVWASARPGGSRAVDRAVAVGRLVVAAGLAVDLLGDAAADPAAAVMAFGAPCLWLFLWPLAAASPGQRLAQVWLGLLALLQWLHAFPVPGSQVAWGTFLALPIVALGGWEACLWWAPARPPSDGRAHAFTGALAAALGVATIGLGFRLAERSKPYFAHRPLQLPGAEGLRLSDYNTALYRILNLNATAHADVLFSYPGLYSFNLWSGRPTPTLANLTHWFSLLDAARQQAIQQGLQAHPRACVIEEKGLTVFLAVRGMAPRGALVDYIERDFEPAFALGDFEFLVRRGRRILPLDTAQIYAGPAGAAFPSLLRLNLLLAPDDAVASMALVPLDGAPGEAQVIEAATSRVEATPVNLQGEARGPARVVTWPFRLQGPTALNVYFERRLVPLKPAETGIALRDAAGRELALLLLIP